MDVRKAMRESNQQKWWRGERISMYDYIKGQLVHMDATMIVVENGGIGYQIQTANPFRFRSVQAEVVIYTYQYVREDMLVLYGFTTREERALFEKLLQVSGVGPKGALAILASSPARDIVQAIQREDTQYLIQFPGIGKKTAQRLVIDLKDQLQDLTQNWTGETEEGQEASFLSEDSTAESSSQALTEALEALKALGYTDKEVKKAIPKMKKQAAGEDTESYVKVGLQILMNG